MPRKPPTTRKRLRKPLPEEFARDAITHEEEAPGGKVRMTFRVVLPPAVAEALAARPIREEMQHRQSHPQSLLDRVTDRWA
jgi:hypothetical protein